MSEELYNIPINKENTLEGETPIFRAPGYEKSILKIENNHTILTNYKKAFEKYYNYDFLGERIIDKNGNLLKEYKFYKYKEIEEKINYWATNIVNRNLAHEKREYKDYNLKFIGIYSINTLNWYLTEMACVIQNITIVPIYDTLGEEAVEFTFNQTKLTTLFLSSIHYLKVLDDIKNKKYVLEYLVIMDYRNFTDEMKNKNKLNLKIIYFEDLLEKCDILPWADVKQDDIYTFSYTSGTTGEPKGAMISHRNMISFIEGGVKKMDFKEHEVYVSFLPLAHVMEKMLFNVFLTLGCKIGLYNGDKNKLIEDFQILKPTVFSSAPRLFVKFYRIILKDLENISFIKKKIIDLAIYKKLNKLKSTGDTEDKLLDNLIFNKLKEKFGGKMRLMITGGAPISEEILNFLKVIFCSNIYEIYGQTEGSGGEFTTDHKEILGEHVGGVNPNLEFKLVDIKDKNYLSTDKDENGNLSPRGEIWVRGEAVIQGYYKNELKTKEAIKRMDGEKVVMLAKYYLKEID